VIQDGTAGNKAVRDLVFDTGGKWNDPATLKSGQALADWTSKGYISKGASGVSQDAAVETFTSGGSLFLIQGTWELATVQKELGSDAGFVALNGADSSDPVAQGGEGLAWAITSKSKHPDVAAAYIDFITNAKASQLLVDTGNLPAVPPSDWSPKSGTLAADVADQWKKISASDGLTPYLDYTTPTFYDTLTAGVQNVITGQATAKQFVDSLQSDYEKFQSTK
jgi:raffinose/stachyose/melibiose transport system substrate-binding protein